MYVNLSREKSLIDTKHSKNAFWHLDRNGKEKEEKFIKRVLLLLNTTD